MTNDLSPLFLATVIRGGMHTCIWGGGGGGGGGGVSVPLPATGIFAGGAFSCTSFTHLAYSGTWFGWNMVDNSYLTRQQARKASCYISLAYGTSRWLSELCSMLTL